MYTFRLAFARIETAALGVPIALCTQNRDVNPLKEHRQTLRGLPAYFNDQLGGAEVSRKVASRAVALK